MHQAIEAKEGVEIKQENQTLATITLQNYFRLYEKLSGMTGTAQTEAAEFNKVYNVGVVTIPTHRPMIRVDQPDVIYKTEKAKFQAVVEDIAERHAHGQPVLVGTVSVENSEILSQLLRRRGVAARGAQREVPRQEAEIIAQAGRKGGVTVATNMAGRGTDILLGGNPEFLAAAELRQRGHRPRKTTTTEYDKAFEELLPELGRSRATPRPRRSSPPAGSTCSAPSGTSPAASTTSSAAAPAGRATRASPGSTCRCRTS